MRVDEACLPAAVDQECLGRLGRLGAISSFLLPYGLVRPLRLVNQAESPVRDRMCAWVSNQSPVAQRGLCLLQAEAPLRLIAQVSSRHG
jgi:hypothetical protein